ncbi:MAG TPA: hypothetical protein VHR45_25115 [Thermoanaerobaculia bacterium]|nr:hypothetical protein [Thermoanaerobaculia bacterium]
MIHRFLAALAALLMAVPAVALPPSSQALLRVHASLTEFWHGRAFVDVDLFVHGDGAVTGSLTASREVTCIDCRWPTTSGQGSGSAEQFATLLAVLTENRIGSQSGDCIVGAENRQNMPASGTYEVTWYGRNARRSSLRVQIGNDTDSCPAEVSNIIRAIETYASQARVPASGLWTPF